MSMNIQSYTSKVCAGGDVLVIPNFKYQVVCHSNFKHFITLYLSCSLSDIAAYKPLIPFEGSFFLLLKETIQSYIHSFT